MTSGEPVTWKELYDNLVKINVEIRNELFITMAVCHGAYLLSAAQICHPSAFRGFIGSFEEIQEYDLTIRYEDFYAELFSSLDLNMAYDSLVKANPSLPNSYKCYGAEYVFARVCLDYAKTKCSEEALNERAKHIIEKGNLKQDKNTIKELIRKRQEECFNKSYEIFFMIDNYPELSNTVEFPNNFDKMKAWFQSFHQGIVI